MANQAGSDETYDRIHRKTWSKRTSGFLGAATLFGGLGLVGGLVASFMPAILDGLGVAGVTGGLPSTAAVMGNMALFAGAASWLGLTIGADVGSNAGAATAMIEEQERRDRSRGPSPAPEKSAAPTREPRMFNIKTALLMGAVFAAFGAMVAMSPITAPVVALAGFKAGTAAAGIAAATVLGMFGTTMGINFPVISNRLANKYSEILKGDAFENKPEQAAQPQPQPELAAEQAPPAPAQPQQGAPHAEAGTETSKHSSCLVRFCVTNIKSRSEACEHDHTDSIITR